MAGFSSVVVVLGSIARRVIFREGICKFVQDFEAQIEADPIANPDTVIEGGKTPKGSSEVKAGQEEKSSSGHQLQSISSTGVSWSSSSSSSP